MGWIEPLPVPHRCQLPSPTSGGIIVSRVGPPDGSLPRTGSRWKCDECGLIYVLEMGHDQRDGSWHTWTVEK